MSQLYTFTMKDIDGNDYSFEKLKEKTVLLVNTASKCGFTPQFEGLQKLHEKYSDKGLVILGFPSNDFMFQDPGTNAEIKNFCLLNYGVDFQMFEKIHVRGKKAHLLYQYLAQGDGHKEFAGNIKWNFTKFLFDRQGRMAGRFAPTVKPEEMETDIVKRLE